MSLPQSWKFFYIISVPILLAWIPFVFVANGRPRKDGNCFYLILLMIAAWTTDAISSVPTALLAVCMVPLLGIQKASEVALNCMTEQGMLLLSQTMIGCAFIHSECHKRMALQILSYSGNCNLRLFSAIFVVTLCSSIVISSPTATLLMCATAVTCIQESVEDNNEDPNKAQKQTERRITGMISQADLDALNEIDTIEPNNGMTFTSEGVGKGSGSIPEVAVSNITGQAAGSGPVQPSVMESGQGSMVKNENEDSTNRGPKNKQDVAGDTVDLEDDLKADGDKRAASVEESNITLNIMERGTMSRKLKKRFFIGIYFAANIGGLALPHTSPTMNLMYEFADILKQIQNIPFSGKPINSLPLHLTNHGATVHLTILLYIGVVLPVVIILGSFAWLYLAYVFTNICTFIPGQKKTLLGKRNAKELELLMFQQNIYKVKLEKMGKLNGHQILVISMLPILIILWISRDPRFGFTTYNMGWSTKVSQDKNQHFVRIGDSAATLLVVILMFIVPRANCWCPSSKKDSKAESSALLSWKFVESNVPWNVAITMGGQYIIANAVWQTGLVTILTDPFSYSYLKRAILPITCIFGSLVASELWGGFATITLMTPSYASFSVGNSQYGYVAISSAVISSLCFMFPVATPTNLMVFWTASGDVTILDMIKYGALMDVISCLVVVGVHYALGDVLLDNLLFT